MSEKLCPKFRILQNGNQERFKIQYFDDGWNDVINVIGDINGRVIGDEKIFNSLQECRTFITNNSWKEVEVV